MRRILLGDGGQIPNTSDRSGQMTTKEKFGSAVVQELIRAGHESPDGKASFQKGCYFAAPRMRELEMAKELGWTEKREQQQPTTKEEKHYEHSI
jgi:hypothetical protein